MIYNVNSTPNQAVNQLLQGGFSAFPDVVSQYLPGASGSALNDSLAMSREMQNAMGEPGAYAGAGNTGALANTDSSSMQSSLMPIFMQLMSQMMQMMTQVNQQGNQNGLNAVNGQNNQNAVAGQDAVDGGNGNNGANAAKDDKKNTTNPDKKQTEQMLEEAARKYGIPPDILKSVAWKESSWNAGATGDGGQSHGMMQIYKTAHPDYDVQKGEQAPSYNIEYGAKFLKSLYDQYGSWPLAVQHYNGSGPAAEKYAQSVMGMVNQKPWGTA
ncbi:MAG: transglycosylase SLT domain-containing protein [Vulcanimicrobiota bacterium]